MKVEISDYSKNSKRKTKVSVSKSDTWSLDDTLARVILPALKKYKKYADKTVTWGELFPENYHEMPRAQQNKESKFAAKRQTEILDKMIWSFEEKVSGRTFTHIGKTEEDRRKYYEKLQEGFDLFGKYYQALWW